MAHHQRPFVATITTNTERGMQVLTHSCLAVSQEEAAGMAFFATQVSHPGAAVTGITAIDIEDVTKKLNDRMAIEVENMVRDQNASSDRIQDMAVRSQRDTVDGMVRHWASQIPPSVDEVMASAKHT